MFLVWMFLKVMKRTNVFRNVPVTFLCSVIERKCALLVLDEGEGFRETLIPLVTSRASWIPADIRYKVFACFSFPQNTHITTLCEFWRLRWMVLWWGSWGSTHDGSGSTAFGWDAVPLDAVRFDSWRPWILLLAGWSTAGCGGVRRATAWDLLLSAGCCAAGYSEVRLTTALDSALGWLVWCWVR